MALWWIDVARNNLLLASNSYADIQKQLDRYNKIFETYATASPETQMRAASVMRQALDEYNGLKKQQEQNALKIYEAQQWVNYYKKNDVSQMKPTSVHSLQSNMVESPIVEITRAMPTEEIPVISTATPWDLNNNTPTTNVEVNAIDTNRTANVSASTNIQKSAVNPTAPVGVTKILASQTPKYQNTTIWPANTNKYTINTTMYWPGSVATMPWTWSMITIPNTTSSWRKNNSSNMSKTLNNWIRQWAKFVYNYLKK